MTLKTLIVDTETNCLPPRPLPKGFELPSAEQPALFQLGCTLYDGDVLVDSIIDYLRPINADGTPTNVPVTLPRLFELCDAVNERNLTEVEIAELTAAMADYEWFKNHGHDQEVMKDIWRPYAEILPEFLAMVQQADRVICHNIKFDFPVILAAFERANLPTDDLLNAACFCSMQTLTDYLKIPQEKGFYKYKSPRLSEAYEILFGIARSETELHDAEEDARILAEVVWEIDRRLLMGEDLRWWRYDYVKEERALSNGLWAWGQHKGKPFKDIPIKSIEWALDNSPVLNPDADIKNCVPRDDYFNEDYVIAITQALEETE